MSAILYGSEVWFLRIKQGRKLAKDREINGESNVRDTAPG